MRSQTYRQSKWRTFFRRLRIAFFIFIFLLVCAALYLNRVGLPNFVKDPLLAKLRDRGIDLQVNRLRWSWTRGIVGENVLFARAKEVLSPQLSVKEVEIKLDPRALAKFNVQVIAIILREGKFRWPTDTNQPQREITANNLNTELKLLADDRWELDRFQAEFHGAKLSLAGSLTNASTVRELFKPRTKKRPFRLQHRLSEFAATLEKIKFASPPELNVLVRGDARDPQSFRGSIMLHAPEADTPWGKLRDGLFSLRTSDELTNKTSRAEFKLEAVSAETKWGAAEQLDLRGHVSSLAGDTNHVAGDVFLSAKHVQTEWVSGTNVQFLGTWIHAKTNPIPISGKGDLELQSAQTKWGNAARGHLALELREVQTNSGGENWGWWNKISPFALRWECEVSGVESPKLQIEELIFSGDWRAPELRLEKIHSRLYEGELNASATLNVETRRVEFALVSDFDGQKTTPLLTEGGRRWLQRFSWQQPPKLRGTGAIVLPSWTNKHPDWRVEVQPTLELNGEFLAEHGGAYKNVPASTARGHFIYSNMVWTLPDLTVTRPEGGAELFHRANDRTKDYYWKIHAAIDPKALRPLLETNAQRGLDYFEFTAPPVLDGEVWGRFRDYERTAFRGVIALGNFSFRGETISAFQTAIGMTNKFISLVAPKISRGEEKMTASGMGFDVETKQFFFTNGFSTADPMAVARAIGQKTAKNFAPYQFLKPPTVRAQGMIQIRPRGRPDAADMHFDVDGGPFHWNKFTADQIAGTVLWRDQTLMLTNVSSTAFYDGKCSGNASFAFQTPRDTEFAFEVRASDVNFRSLMQDLSGRTNNLEGLINGYLNVTNANSANTNSWQGFGRVHLRDGMIWEIPVFGIFSPMLNAVFPGLGNSRVSEGKGKFIITNSVVRSDDLEFRATALRMNYHGSVDFGQNVDARVEAELLRDVWGVGPVFSAVFWPITKMFEYKVTGTLSHPKTEPLYLFPKLLLMPFRPLKVMKELFQESALSTNAPPAKATSPKQTPDK
jgi:hypothetical protein